jgi:hypothetical protein
MTSEVFDPTCVAPFVQKPLTKFVINAGYVESTRNASLELIYPDGFDSPMEAMLHLVTVLKEVSHAWALEKYSPWRDPETMFMQLHIEELDIINADGIEEAFNERGWYIFPEFEDKTEPVYVRNFLRLIDNEDAYIEWTVGKIDSNSYQEKNK